MKIINVQTKLPERKKEDRRFEKFDSRLNQHVECTFDEALEQASRLSKMISENDRRRAK